MRMTERLQNLVTEGAPTERIKEVAVEDGMKTLLVYSLELRLHNSKKERVTFTDSGLRQLKAKRKSSLECRTCNAELKPEWLECPYCMSRLVSGDRRQERRQGDRGNLYCCILTREF